MDILLKLSVVSALAISSYFELVGTSYCLIAFIAIAITFKTRAANLVAFRFFAYLLIVVFHDNGLVEIDADIDFLAAILMFSMCIDGVTILWLNRINSPVKYPIFVSFIFYLVTLSLLILLGYFVATIYNIVNVIIPVAIIGVMSYESITRIE